MYIKKVSWESRSEIHHQLVHLRRRNWPEQQTNQKFTIPEDVELTAAFFSLLFCSKKEQQQQNGKVDRNEVEKKKLRKRTKTQKAQV